MDAIDSLTWPEAARLAGANALGLWPLGSIEAHGPHLPLATDLFISRAVAARAGERLAARGYAPFLLPELPFGVTRYAAEFSGTLGLSPGTLKSIIGDVAAETGRHGLRRLVLVNNHLEPAQLETLAEAVLAASAGPVRVIAPNPCERRWARTLGDEFKRGECHAGSYETSLVIAGGGRVDTSLAKGLAPVPIDLAKAMREGRKTFREAGADQAYFGRPAEASREEGDALLARLVEMVVAEVLEKLPL
ncbi:MAG TPA: creatininase family protein [Myxococcales bacterium]|nr:creatininase family protein [Myxococcales bacterium]